MKFGARFFYIFFGLCALIVFIFVSGGAWSGWNFAFEEVIVVLFFPSWLLNKISGDNGKDIAGILLLFVPLWFTFLAYVFEQVSYKFFPVRDEEE